MRRSAAALGTMFARNLSDMKSRRLAFLRAASHSAFRVLAVAAAFACCCFSANAAFDTVIVRGALQASDHMDWSGAGATFNQVSNPLSLTSAGGMDVTVSMASGSFVRYDQNFVPDDFSGGWN